MSPNRGPETSPEGVRADLGQRAAQLWGAERQAELAAALDTTANALARLAQAPFELLADEPDFIGGRSDPSGQV